MDWLKNILRKKKQEKMERIDAKRWREIYWRKGDAREALVNLVIEDTDGKMKKVEHVVLSNGRQIPVSEVTEEQAHEFMRALCPETP